MANIKVYKYPCKAQPWQVGRILQISESSNRHYNLIIEAHNEIMTEYPMPEDRKELGKDRMKEIQAGLRIKRLEKMRGVRKKATSELGLHYGTYALTEAAAERATKGQRVARFSRFHERRNHRAGTPLNNGQRVAVPCLQTDQRLRLEPFVPAKRIRKYQRERLIFERDHLGYMRSRRVLEDREIELTEWGSHYAVIYHQGTRHEPMRIRCRLHRPLPEDGFVVQAWVQVVRRKWSHYDTELILVVDAESHALPPPPDPETDMRGECGLDVGWRVREGGRIRVAYTSERDEVLTPPRMRAQIKQAEQLKGIADDNVLLAWGMQMGPIPVAPNGRPYAVGRLSKILQQMATGYRPDLPHIKDPETGEEYPRKYGDPQNLWHGWWKQHRHLMDWSCALDEKARRSRREHWRREAKRLCAKYKVIHMEAVDIRTLARSQIGGDARVEAAPGEFLAMLRVEAAKAYTVLNMKKSTNTTRICHACGFLNPNASEDKARQKLVVKCQDCGEEYDQDYNAAQVLETWADCEACKGKTKEERDVCEVCQGKAKVFVGNATKTRRKKKVGGDKPADGGAMTA